MSLNIREVLHRRTDLSTFVVHLTRWKGFQSPKAALQSIMKDRQLRAMSPMGWAKEQDVEGDETKQTQRVVCFSETPLEHICWLVADIEHRQVQLQPYGLAFTKMVARRLGVNPIWYVDMSLGPGGSFRDWTLVHALDRMRDEAVEAEGDFHQQPIARITPFMEQMGTGADWQKEWWWEREWRHVGPLSLPNHGIIWLCPAEEHSDFAESVGAGEPIIDPTWGLEQIIAHLARFPLEDITPFSRRDPPDIPF